MNLNGLRAFAFVVAPMMMAGIASGQDPGLQDSLIIGNLNGAVIAWDGSDNFGGHVSSGVYLYRLTAGEYKATSRVTLLK